MSADWNRMRSRWIGPIAKKQAPTDSSLKDSLSLFVCVWVCVSGCVGGWRQQSTTDSTVLNNIH